MRLDVDEGATVTVTLDPNYRGDLQSATVPQKLRVEYVDNPQKDAIDLVRGGGGREEEREGEYVDNPQKDALDLMRGRGGRLMVAG